MECTWSSQSTAECADAVIGGREGTGPLASTAARLAERPTSSWTKRTYSGSGKGAVWHSDESSVSEGTQLTQQRQTHVVVCPSRDDMQQCFRRVVAANLRAHALLSGTVARRIIESQHDQRCPAD